METSLQEFRFSKHFNQLSYIGIRLSESSSPWKNKKIYSIYQVLGLMAAFTAAGLQLTDLYFGMGSLKKITFNLCTTTLTVSNIIKLLILLMHKKESLEYLRLNLWKDSFKFNDEEDAAVMETAFKKLQFICKWFYRAGVIFFTAWIIVSYFSYAWGPRELPFPAYLPVNTTREIEFVPSLILETFLGGYVIKLVIEIQLAIFSVLFQIEAQYKILIKNIFKLNDIYEEFDAEMNSKVGFGAQFQKRREVNDYLKKEFTEKLLKTFVIRQQRLIEYSNEFEYVFNEFLFIHIFGSSLLGIMNGLALTMVTYDLSVKLCYQAGYLALIMIDLMFICHHVEDMTTQCTNVGEAMYMTNWHKMDPDLRKIVCLIIIRSQKPPKITSGKFFLVDLNSYMHMLKNITSWLMLFRQLGVK